MSIHSFIEHFRVKKVLPLIKGRLLDIGCGYNNLVKMYKNGIGVDVFNWGNVDMIVNNSSVINLPDKSFDTIAFLASLNHIPNRLDALKEAHRLLKDDGQVIITMISPFVGFFVHNLLVDDESKVRGGMKEGEVYGLTDSEVRELIDLAGFNLKKKHYFEFFINKVYIAKKNIVK